MRSYYRVMLGPSSIHAADCFEGNYIGTNFDVAQDLTGHLPDDWQAFNKEFIPIYQQIHPGKNRISAGLACGALWTVSKGIKEGDIVLCPDGKGRYHVAEVTGEYSYDPTVVLFHRRPVRWLDRLLDSTEMSEALLKSVRSYTTAVNLTRPIYIEEIERLIASSPIEPIGPDGPIEDVTAFAMEKHLEDFLVQNWAHTELGKEYDIYAEDGQPVGQQYLTDTGPLDILAVSKDKQRLLVVELKKGRASDTVVGQTLRYMGYVQEVLAEPGQTVHGAIIALEDDQRIRRALAVTPTVHFYRYQISFRLVKV